MKSPQFTLRGFRKPREMVLQTLGALEREVMEEVWRRGSASVRDLHQACGERVAYTTLMTTLARLYHKKLLKRRKESRAFIYTPRVSREEFERVVARAVIGGLLHDDAEPVLACIVEAVSEHNRELLDELDRLIKQKQREIGRKE